MEFLRSLREFLERRQLEGNLPAGLGQWYDTSGFMGVAEGLVAPSVFKTAGSA